MRIFTCTDHDCHYVGGASVVLAEDEAAARSLLDAQLIEHGLLPASLRPYDLREISLDKAQAFVLHDGDY